MKLARYVGNGEVEIVDEPAPVCPAGGLLVRTEACGLCSGELMSWYMDQKLPHVLGHECVGTIIESQSAAFPVGARVFAHHHAPCGACPQCRAGRPVHCLQWKRTHLDPGGMAEQYGVSEQNLTDAFLIPLLSPEVGALIEPLACVMKALTISGIQEAANSGRPVRTAVIGLGFMGLLHAFALRAIGVEPVCFEISESRRRWATEHSIGNAFDPSESLPRDEGDFDFLFVCPGAQPAIDFAVRHTSPGAIITLFSPLAPGTPLMLDVNALYFRDAQLRTSYSAGPADSQAAYRLLIEGAIPTESVISDFISLAELPAAYQKMKNGEILKPMVLFGPK